MHYKAGLSFLAAITIALATHQFGTADDGPDVVCGYPYGFTKCGQTVPEQKDCASAENGGVCLFYPEVIEGITYLVPKCTISGQHYKFYMADYTTNFDAGVDTHAYLQAPYERTKKACFVNVTCGENCSWDFVDYPKCTDGSFNDTSFINVVQSYDGDCINGVWVQP